jgi:hypothetical protein
MPNGDNGVSGDKSSLKNSALNRRNILLASSITSPAKIRRVPVPTSPISTTTAISSATVIGGSILYPSL